MIEFIKKTMDWVLQKEQDAANHCYIKTQDVQKQIDAIKHKKGQLQEKFDDNVKELDHIINRLELIKASSNQCRR